LGGKDRLQRNDVRALVQAQIDTKVTVPHVVAEGIVATDPPDFEQIGIWTAEIGAIAAVGVLVAGAGSEYPLPLS
jgi:hypothetical protein